MELKDQLLNPDQIIKILTADINQDTCSVEGKKKFEEKVKMLTDTLDEIDGIAQEGLKVMTSLEEKIGAISSKAEIPDVPNPVEGIKSITDAIKPITDIFNRFGDKLILIILLIITYKFSDLLLGPMAMPFYNEIGFTKEQGAIITNAFGIVVTMSGAFLGGLLIYKYSIMRTMLIGAFLMAITNLFFAGLDYVGPNLTFLTVTISVDNLSQGLAGTALIAYLSSLKKPL